MNIQWYPGHMTKARRAMEQDIKLVDLVIELLDARTPLASRNPDIDKLGANKLRLILLNKSDVADPAVNRRWESWFESKGYTVVLLDSRSGAGKKQVQAAVSQVCQAKIERDRRRGILNRPVRAMVVGIPNVGKSTFINTFAGKAVAKTGNKPGVTRGNQWIRLNKEVELLDTPGILWPKFEDPEVGVHLAMIGSVNDEILDIRELACELLKLLRTLYPEKLQERYSFSEEELAQEMKTGFELLEKIAKIRGCLLKGQELDTEKAARLVMDDFRSGRLGQISIERPEE